MLFRYLLRIDEVGGNHEQQAILEAEKIYGDDNWSLDTILQENGNIHLYEKLGYKRTGKMERISNLMDIVYFEKNQDFEVRF